ncbi:hypothetical protein [Colwellia sp. BRX8-9]|uniref:hypothetical protein n=1 Tax=Colwellia sp. BRX8-9 TaxID=2759831 RepID=UPI0015F36845|nr:hypothetical protein [Colwellia sp. BRX8-9]MBA6348333.1 hypothetical protein [Colwellia sp. BRX8-9]
MDSESLLDPVLNHLKVLLNTNVPEKQLVTISNIFNLKGGLHEGSIQDAQVNNVDIKEFTQHTAKKYIDKCYYIRPFLLAQLKRNHCSEHAPQLITNKWVDTKHPVDNSNLEDTSLNVSVYDGDHESFIDAIKNIMPDYDSEAASNPITIMLPYSNEFNQDKFISEGKGWDIYNLDKDTTAQLFSSTADSLYFIASLQLLGLNDAPINQLLTQAGLLEDISAYTDMKKTLLGKLSAISRSTEKSDIEFIESIQSQVSKLSDFHTYKDFEFLSRLKDEISNEAKGHSITKLNDFVIEVNKLFEKKEWGDHLKYLQCSDNGKNFIPLSQLYGNLNLDGVGLAPKSEKEVQNLVTEVIKKAITPSFKSNISKNYEGEQFKTFSHLNRLKYQKSEGKCVVARDLKSIRKGLSYILSHTSGVAITLNVPFIDSKVSNKRMGTPTLLMPHFWTETINFLRDSTQKKRKGFTPLTAKDLNVEAGKEEVEEMVTKFSKMFGLITGNENAEVPLTKKTSTKKNMDMLRCNEEITKKIFTSGYVKQDFPIRLFPDPK